MKNIFTLSAKIICIIFLLGFSSCNNDDSVEPNFTDNFDPDTDTSGIAYDTTTHSFDLKIITPDSTLTHYSDISVYALQNTYSISLRDIFSDYTLLANDIQAIYVSDQSTSKFFSIDYTKSSTDVTVDLICSPSSYYTNEHIITASVVTSTEVHLITCTFDLLESESSTLYTALLKQSPSASITSTSSNTWTTNVAQPYDSDIDQYNSVFHSSFYFKSTTNPKDPTTVTLGSLSLSESSDVIIILGPSNKIYLYSDGTTVHHTLTSASNNKAYISGTTGLHYFTF